MTIRVEIEIGEGERIVATNESVEFIGIAPLRAKHVKFAAMVTDGIKALLAEASTTRLYPETPSANRRTA
jgi:hypothetical protein